MSFASPIWLLGLLPWAALVAWLLIGRREQAHVPFLSLWPTSMAPTRTTRSFQPPPVALVFILLALLLALVGAARPDLHAPRNGPLISIIVDLNITMAPKDELVGEAATAIEAAYGFGPVDLVLVPDGQVQISDRSDWSDAVRKANLTSLRTIDALRAAVVEAQRRNDAPIILLSNQALGIEDDRLVQIATDSSPQNASLVRVSAGERPRTQVMATVRNQSSQSRAELVVETEGQTHRQTIDLPATGGEMNYFVDLPAPGRVISIELLTDDEIPADNRAWLVRQRIWPRVEARAALSPELQRMIDAYRKLRPSDDASPNIIVATDAGDALAAAIVASGEATELVSDDAPLRVEDHPINANVDWNRVTASGARAAPLPGGSWKPLVARGGQVLVAGRESPARQVWIGLGSDTWPRESDFVIFWTNVFDWLGASDSGERFVAEPMRPLGSEWRRLDDLSGSPPLPLDPPPGVWGRDDGALLALNVLDVHVDPPPATNWRRKLRTQRAATPAAWVLGRASLVGAMIAALVASMTCRSTGPRARPARTAA